MIIVGVPYSCREIMNMSEIIGGSAMERAPLLVTMVDVNHQRTN
jgi:hypothetical protein